MPNYSFKDFEDDFGCHCEHSTLTKQPQGIWKVLYPSKGNREGGQLIPCGILTEFLLKNWVTQDDGCIP